MKRATRRLVVNRETIRALAKKELEAAFGGDDAVPQSKGAVCPAPAQAVAPSYAPDACTPDH